LLDTEIADSDGFLLVIKIENNADMGVALGSLERLMEAIGVFLKKTMGLVGHVCLALVTSKQSIAPIMLERRMISLNDRRWSGQRQHQR
jgi:hypothetical protein